MTAMSGYQDINDDQCDLAEPSAAPMSESLRAFGYELPSAIADLVDNSIFADARNVWIDFYWNGNDSTVCVTDDGRGMTQAELIAAMRPGSRNPLESRDPKDLGRYGLGLKTASFSQCRKLSVRSRTPAGAETTRCWDLDFVTFKNKWLLLRDAGPGAEPHFGGLARLNHGTAVVWEHIDRLVKGADVDDESHRGFFHDRIEGVERYLSMVFHRFMEGSRALKIQVNGNSIKPWDPFLKNEKATQQIADERIEHLQDRIRVVPFVLPHFSKLTPDSHRAAGGPRGWNQQQGFYVYRNERLLVPGDWLGLPFAKEEHFKLARIQVDIPNSMDQEWDIDVTKSKARPPDRLRRELKYIAERTRRRASEVYRHRGRILARKSSQEYVFVWQQLTRRGKTVYRINREHPLVRQAVAEDKRLVAPLLRLVEETVPVQQLVISNSEHPETQSAPFEGVSTTEIRGLLKLLFDVMLQSQIPPMTAIERLRAMEPFDAHPEIVQAFEEEYNSGRQ